MALTWGSAAPYIVALLTVLLFAPSTGREQMPFDKRAVWFTAAAVGFACFVALVATLALLTGEARAAAPVAGPPKPPASAAMPVVPNVGVWTDIAPFPTASTSPTPS